MEKLEIKLNLHKHYVPWSLACPGFSASFTSRPLPRSPRSPVSLQTLTTAPEWGALFQAGGKRIWWGVAGVSGAEGWESLECRCPNWVSVGRGTDKKGIEEPEG